MCAAGSPCSLLGQNETSQAELSPAATVVCGVLRRDLDQLLADAEAPSRVEGTVSDEPGTDEGVARCRAVLGRRVALVVLRSIILIMTSRLQISSF
jgi:hypothetical protein